MTRAPMPRRCRDGRVCAPRGPPRTLQAVRGMNDVLPDEAALWERFEDTVRDVFRRYGYRNLRVPLVEPTPLFVRAIGEVTDVVEKEMYTFEDKLNGEWLTLRPEATAGIVRAAIEHNLTLRAAAARVDRGADVPPRAPAEGPLPPVPSVRRRGARASPGPTSTPSRS